MTPDRVSQVQLKLEIRCQCTCDTRSGVSGGDRKIPSGKTPSGKTPSGKTPIVENSQWENSQWENSQCGKFPVTFLLNIDMLSTKYFT